MTVPCQETFWCKYCQTEDLVIQLLTSELTSELNHQPPPLLCYVHACLPGQPCDGLNTLFMQLLTSKLYHQPPPLLCYVHACLANPAMD